MVLVLLIIGLVYYVVTAQQKKPLAPASAPAPTPIPLDQFPKLPIKAAGSTTQNTVFTVSLRPMQRPEATNTYLTTPQNPIAVGAALAKQYGLPANPKTINGINYWEAGAVSVSSQESPPSLSFSTTARATASSTINGERAQQIAEGYLRDKGFMSTGFALNLFNTQQIGTSGTHPDIAAAGQASEIVVMYRAQINGLTVTDTTGGELRVSVWMDHGGNVVRARAPLFPTVVLQNKQDVIPPEQALVALSNNKATLTSVRREGLSVSSSVINPDIKQAAVTSMELQYFWNGPRGTISPVYVFLGESSDPIKPTQKLDLIYFLAATR